MIKRKCIQCKKEFQTKQSQVDYGNGKYCSRTCCGLSFRGRPGWNKGGTYPEMRGRKFTEEHRRKIGDSKRGNKSYNYKGGYENKMMHVRLRRALKLGARGSHTSQDWEILKNRFNYMCLCCKQHEPQIILTEDHIVPLSLGGSHDISNIQPLCQSCNSRKALKTVDFRFIEEMTISSGPLARIV